MDNDAQLEDRSTHPLGCGHCVCTIRSSPKQPRHHQRGLLTCCLPHRTNFAVGLSLTTPAFLALSWLGSTRALVHWQPSLPPVCPPGQSNVILDEHEPFDYSDHGTRAANGFVHEGTVHGAMAPWLYAAFVRNTASQLLTRLRSGHHACMAWLLFHEGQENFHLYITMTPRGQMFGT
jgi:hypothetical protein